MIVTYATKVLLESSVGIGVVFLSSVSCSYTSFYCSNPLA